MTARNTTHYEVLYWIEESAQAIKLQGTKGSGRSEYSEQNRTLQQREGTGLSPNDR